MGRLVALGPRTGRREEVWRVLVSMVLTLKAHLRCMPERKRRISTISAGCFDGRLVHVSAVDTGSRRSESGVVTAERLLRHRFSSTAP